MTAQELLRDIKDYTGKDYEICSHFTSRLPENKQKTNFDILYPKPEWLTNDFDCLERYARAKGYKINRAGYLRARLIIT